MRDDDDPEKWRMKGQTEIKHQILQAYLKPWLPKISEVASSVNYIDGFAGRGRYEDGSPGSPIIAMQAAADKESAISRKLNSFNCYFIEENASIYGDLEYEIENFKPNAPNFVNTFPENTTFKRFSEGFIEKNQKYCDPSFIFVDPFGFSGLPFEVVNQLLNLRTTGTEVFITFMSGKMAQFMENDEHASAIDEILGTSIWRDRIDTCAGKDDRAKQFVQLYQDRLRNQAGVKHVWPFEMLEETKSQNCYYLIHATNHFEGFKLMKKVMYRKGAGDQFAYLGPDHYPFEDGQDSLSNYGMTDQQEADIEGLSEYLYERFNGEKMTFNEVLEQSLEETKLVVKHYREACKNLAKRNKVQIEHRPNMPKGRTQSGLGEDDYVIFEDQSLERWI